MSASLSIISSMATRQVLTDLVAQFQSTSNLKITIESVGGVDAARRVRAGEVFDIVVLAAHAIDDLIEVGRIVPGSRADLAKSGVSIVVPSGSARPDIGSEDAVRRAVVQAPTLGYSTGPSGVHLTKLFERWGIAEAIKDRIVQAPPGVSVGSLVAEGKVALGFQQLSELLHVPGIDVLGPLPPAIQTITTFSAGLSTTSMHARAVRAVLDFMTSPRAARVKLENGLEPA
jgi:molybdate transport system substrate-binding protein